MRRVAVVVGLFCLMFTGYIFFARTYPVSGSTDESSSIDLGEYITVDGDGVYASSNALEVTTRITGNYIDITLCNSSSEVVRGIAVVCSRECRLVPYCTLYGVGELGGGESVVYRLSFVDLGSGFLRNLAWSIGGFYRLLLVIPIILLGVIATVVALIFYIRRPSVRGSRVAYIGLGGFVGTVVLAGITLVILYFAVGSREYISVGTGEDYVQSFRESVLGSDAVYDVRYNQDIVTYETYEEDDELPFEMVYEYDPSVECTAEPIVKVEGVNGKRHVVWRTTYRNGEKVEDVKESESVISKPVDQVLIQGTKTVVETQNVEALKQYVADESMYVGQYALQTSASDAREHVGKKEITWNWDMETNTLVSSETVIKEPGVDVWRAGSLVKVTEEIPYSTVYRAVENKEIGYRETTSFGRSGSRVSVYVTEIDTSTGERIEGSVLRLKNYQVSEPKDAVIKVGVLRVEDVESPIEENISIDNSLWSCEETVVSPGESLIERVSSVMTLDEITGEVTDSVDYEVGREVLQKGSPREVIRGGKEPYWVEEKEILGEVEFNTVYVASPDVTGDDQIMIREGEKGSLYTTRLVAVDEEGNPVSGYEPQVVQENALSAPIDAIIGVAEDSPLLK